MGEEFTSQESSAPFNMALSTLEALRKILSHIEQIYSDPTLPDALRQKLKVNLVKRFYVDSSPLLGPEITEKFKPILKLRANQLVILTNQNGSPEETNRTKITFDDNLEEVLDTYLIEMQLELQKQHYYMPPRQDLGSAVGRF